MSTRRWRIVLLALIAAHVTLGALRLPGKVIAKRARDIDRYRQVGDIRYFLDTDHQRGWEAVAWIREHVPEDAIVLWQGSAKGPLEFVPGLILPRLLVASHAVPAEAKTWLGRTIARGIVADRSGVLLIVGESDRVHLAVR